MCETEKRFRECQTRLFCRWMLVGFIISVQEALYLTYKRVVRPRKCFWDDCLQVFEQRPPLLVEFLGGVLFAYTQGTSVFEPPALLVTFLPLRERLGW